MDSLRRLVATVRRALLLRGALQWTAWLSIAFGVGALLVAWLAPSWPRWPSLALLALGPFVGVLIARRRMPPEGDLVVFVDLRLHAGQSILTAWEAARDKDESPFAGLARAQAEPMLRAARRRDVRPGMIVAPGPVVGAFKRIGWGWGGSWRGLQDFQHVSSTGK